MILPFINQSSSAMHLLMKNLLRAFSQICAARELMSGSLPMTCVAGVQIITQVTDGDP